MVHCLTVTKLALLPQDLLDVKHIRKDRMEMKNKYHKHAGLFCVFFIICTTALAKHDSHHPLSPEDWNEVREKVEMLEGAGLMPTLLPVIMSNRDALQLTDEQVNAFRAWRKKNYTNMVNVMNKIIEKMVEFRVESLSPSITADQLLALQSEIQELQVRLLKLKLSCRELVMTTFTDEQWDNFAFIISDNPKLASLMLQVDTGRSK
jgi:hypothetical protein